MARLPSATIPFTDAVDFAAVLKTSATDNAMRLYHLIYRWKNDITTVQKIQPLKSKNIIIPCNIYKKMI